MEQYVSIYDDVIREISDVMTFKPIVYLVSEESDVMEDIFRRASCFNFRLAAEDGCEDCAYDDVKMANGNVYTIPEGGYRGLFVSKRQGDVSYSVVFADEEEYFVVRDFHLWTGKKELLRAFVKYLEGCGQWPYKKHLFISSPYRDLPEGYNKYVEIIDVPRLGIREIAKLIVEEQNRALHRSEDQKITLEEYLKMPDDSIICFKGLNRDQIRSVLYRVTERFGCVTRFGLREQAAARLNDKAMREVTEALIIGEKKQMAAQSGLIEFIDVDEELTKPGGMEGLLEWLGRNKKILEDPKRAKQFDVKLPKGVLIAGLPGSGKSLIAKYSARVLNLPLIQFKIGMVLNSLVGGSEGQLERVLKTIEAVSPVVVWIDEIEKEFSGIQGKSDGDSGVSKRIFARILNWMQENAEKSCFICATANHVDTLPSELLRRGRFDRNYYTFLPMYDDCVNIFVNLMTASIERAPHLYDDEIQKNLRRLGCEVFDGIAEMPGKFFTGADIQGLIEEAKNELFNAAVEGVEAGQPYSYGKFKSALLGVAQVIKPYGESNYQKVLEYWYALKENSFINASLPLEISEGQSSASAAEKSTADDGAKYRYMLFDFEDLQESPTGCKWRPGLKCVSEHAYDKHMFQKLSKGIQDHGHKRTK